jgi:cytidylate kinase
MIIAIDGPAGAGKSSVARVVARALALPFLDTGAMYRAVTLAVLARGVAPEDAAGCERVARSLALEFDPEGRIQIDGRPGEPDIRGSEVTRAVSRVAAHPGVRAAIVAEQRALAARSPGVVAEGRDTTTVVFPGADHKFYLFASAAERARRRAAQERSPERLQEILREIEQRDRLDSSREHSPLRQAPDAHFLDSDGLALEQVVERVLAIVRGEER